MLIRGPHDDWHRLKSYEQQLAQVIGALATDKDNEELLNLQIELENLISLTRQLLETGESSSTGTSIKKTIVAAPVPATDTQDRSPKFVTELKRFSAGEECQAKYAVSVVCPRVAKKENSLKPSIIPLSYRGMEGGILLELFPWVDLLLIQSIQSCTKATTLRKLSLLHLSNRSRML